MSAQPHKRLQDDVPEFKMKWPKVSLREVLQPISRPEIIAPEVTYKILGAHWYAKGLYVKDIKIGSQIQAKQLYRIEEGDFVYNRLFAWKGSFAVATNENHGCYVSNEFPCFAVNKKFAETDYLWKYFSRASVWDEALSLSSGGTPTSRNRLKEEKLLSMKIPLPPLSEQRRIVAKIEQLAAKIEEAREQRRQAIEEADVLNRSASHQFFDIKQCKHSSVKLGNVSTRITKGESPEWQGFSYQDEGPIFIRSENVLWGKLDLSKRTHIPETFYDKLSRSQLQRGDVLINLVGASIGRACVVPDTIGKANVNQAVAVISPRENILNSNYLMRFLISKQTQEILHEGKVETARPNISLNDLRDLSIPLPSLKDQLQIVSYLDNFQSKIDKLKRLQSQTQKELNALMPSILDKAFKGEL